MKDGASEGDHEVAAARQWAILGKAKLAQRMLPDLPPFPWALDYLWSLFQEFSTGLTSNGMGPIMAGWRDLQAWCEAMQHDLEPWEKAALIRLSNLRAVVLSEEAPKPNPKKRHR